MTIALSNICDVKFETFNKWIQGRKFGKNSNIIENRSETRKQKNQSISCS